MVWPGIGQIYSGQPLRGVALLVGAGGLVAIAAWSILSAHGNPLHGLIGGLLAAGLYIFNLFDAHAGVYRHKATNAEKIPRIKKDPWFAVFLSRILPGLGHLYAENFLVGGLLVALFIILASVAGKIAFLLFIPPIITAIAGYHVFNLFPKSHPIKREFLIGLTVCILITGLVTGCLPSLVRQRIDIFEIPSKSMLPTLQIGDRLLVDKAIRRFKSGDIVVFKAPLAAQKLDPQVRSDQFFVKRVIGQPGQLLRVEAGRVYVDNLPLVEADIMAPATYDLAPQVVPTQTYFVLGDNRNNSFDSHVWGWLPAEQIVGRAYKIYWPFGRVRSLLPIP